MKIARGYTLVLHMRHGLVFAAVAALLATPLAAPAALLGRAPATAGGTDYRAYYDPGPDVTWLANANLAATNTFGVGGIAGGGSMTWAKANEWIAAMNAAAYLGRKDWRLPRVTDMAGPGCNFGFTGTDCGYNVKRESGEMAGMFHDALGNASAFGTSGGPFNFLPCAGSPPQYCLVSLGPFVNLAADAYWTGTEFATDSASVWHFEFSFGYQGDLEKSGEGRTWPVIAGDIDLPAAASVLGAGVGDLVTTAQDVATPVSVLVNDLGFGSPVMVTVSSPPAHGVAVISGSPGGPGSVLATYTPATGYVGTDSFSYALTDGVSSGSAMVAVTVLADTDEDGVADPQDNCRATANPSQLDADGDGYGNICDADLNNSGLVTAADYAILRSLIGQPASASALAAAADLNGSGTVTAADYAILRAKIGTPPGPSARRGASNSYPVTGTVSGLTGSGLVLRNNGGDNLSVSANGPLTFATGLANGATYSVSVLTQPSNPSQTCTITNGSGTAGTGSLPTVSLSCTTNSYTVGGTVSGRIASSGSLVLQKNGGETSSPPGNGSYYFGTPLVSGAKYDVRATAQPSTPNQTCSVQNGTGTVANGPVASVNVACGLNGKFYYSVNVGTNTLSIYRVTSSGSQEIYTPAGTAATAPNPTFVVTDPANRFAFVSSSGPNTITSYAINTGTGALAPVATLLIGSTPFLSSVDPDGRFLRVIGSGLTSSYRIHSNGTLTAVESIASGGGSAIEYAFGYSALYYPTGLYLPPDNYYMLWGVTSTFVRWQYRVRYDGALAYLGRDGTYGSGTDPSPVYLPITVGGGCDGIGPIVGSRLELDANANTISLLWSETKCGLPPRLTLLTTAPTGPTPRAVAMNANRTFAYVANAGNSTLSTFAVVVSPPYNPVSSLTPVGSLVATGPDPVAVTLDPDGVHLYVENAGDNTVSYYTINPGTGQPTLTNVQ